MARIWSQGRSLVLGVLLTGLAVAAQETTGWDSRLKDGVAAVGSGQYQQAVQILTVLLSESRSFAGSDPRRTDVALALATAYRYQGRADLAETLYIEAKTWLQAAGPEFRHTLGIAQHGLAEVYVSTGRWNEAENLLSAAADNCQSAAGEKSACAMAAMVHLGELYVLESHNSEAVSMLGPLVERLRNLTPPRIDLLADALHALASAYSQQGRYESAEPLLREALNLSKHLGESHPVFADRLVDLGGLYRLEGNTARGEPLLKKAVSIYEANNDPHLADAVHQLGLIALEEGKYAIAREDMERSLAIYKTTLGPEHVTVATVQAGLAQAYLGERNYKEADSLIQRAISISRACLGDAHAGIAKLLMLAGRIQEREHRSAQADEYYRQALSIYRHAFASDHPDREEAEREYAKFTRSQRK